MSRKNDVLKALSDLEGVAQIARNEMLTHNVYISSVQNKKLADSGAICGGRNACLVGSLYLAHGVPFEDTGGYHVMPEGIDPAERAEFMKNRRGLKLAYDYLNDAALTYMSKHFAEEMERRRDQVEEDGELWGYESSWPPAEGFGEFFFEAILGDDGFADMDDDPEQYQETRRHILKVVSNAKRRLKSDYKELLGA